MPPKSQPIENMPPEVATLRGLVDQIEELETAKAAIMNDLKEVYAEARASGYMVKVLRMVIKRRKRGKVEVADEDALVSQYEEMLSVKITIDLLQAATEPDLARVAAVAVLSALPQDAAELAVAEWHAVLEVRRADAEVQLDLGSIKDTIHYKVRDEPTQSGALASPASVAQEGERAQNEPTRLGEATRLEDTDGGLSTKTAEALTRAGYKTLGDLADLTTAHLSKTVDRFGKKAAEELSAVMWVAGLWQPAHSAQEPRQATAAPAAVIQPAATASPATAAPAVQQSLLGTNGEQPTLRELCRQKEHEVGRERVWALLRLHGVTRLDEAGDKAAAIRADLVALA